MKNNANGGFRPTNGTGLNFKLEAFSHLAMRKAGSSNAFYLAALLIVGWLITGPIFHYSDTWQLVINTFTTIVTFLMVFLIQRAQNKDSQAIQLKLNELVAAVEGASNHLVAVEDLTEDELQKLHDRYLKLVEAAQAGKATRALSIEEAAAVVHTEEKKKRKSRGGTKQGNHRRAS